MKGCYYCFNIFPKVNHFKNSIFVPLIVKKITKKKIKYDN